MIHPTEADIGRSVTYRGRRKGPPAKPEEGVITSFNESFVFVRYGDWKASRATRREDLEWIMPNSFVYIRAMIGGKPQTIDMLARELPAPELWKWLVTLRPDELARATEIARLSLSAPASEKETPTQAEIASVVAFLNLVFRNSGYVIYAGGKPVSIAPGWPARATKEGKAMPNFELANDTIATIPILTPDGEGGFVPPPAGDTFSVASSNPASLGAAIGTVTTTEGNAVAGGPAVVLTPLVQASPGLTVTVTDSAGLTAWTQTVDIVADLSPKSIVLDVADATQTSQAVPTAPGP
jgi:hypothetical protein